MDRETLVAQFMSITQATAVEANFYLDMTHDDLESALAQFFENPRAAPVAPAPAPPVSSGSPFVGSGGLPPSSAPSQPPKKPAPKKPTGGIRSLSDFSNDEPEDDEEKGQSYYTGGEKSGLAVQDPNKKKSVGATGAGGLADEVTQGVFDRAREMGAKSVDEDRRDRPKQESFTGSGYRLGASAAAPTQKIDATKPVQKERQVNLTFWQDGFSVDDGPLRSYEDPANKPFLDAINRGVVPREFMTPETVDTEFAFNLMDRKQDKYVAPPKVFKAFEGSGRTMGGPSVSTPAVASHAPAKPVSFSVDESQPTTSIQIRLADGTRLVSKFNQHKHTINDIRNFILMSRPGMSPNFELQMNFPKKVIPASTNTIAEEKLESSALTVLPK